MNILQINASLFAGQGQSTLLADRFVATLRRANPAAKLVQRDLASDAVPHLTAERFTGFARPAGERTLEQQRAAELSDTLIAELREADTIVIGLPMYNFGVPSTLKAWIDHVARAGETFRYTAQGPQGLLTGKRAYVFATRGGAYAGTPLDTQSAYIRDFLRFVGIVDVEIVYAEGLAMGDERRQESLAAAASRIAELGTAQRAAA
ncbi:MAG TPA: FMN-dependent NADH-azoreductase [Xanthomonadales bacterium]|nr:FMN-dependent NADH-azoreductase [Xanthomonadales bacterium]